MRFGRLAIMTVLCAWLSTAESLPAAEFSAFLQDGVEPLPTVVDPSPGPFVALPTAGIPSAVPTIAMPAADRFGLTGGAALLIMAPFQQGAEAYAINSGLAPTSTVATQTVENFGFNAQAAPLVWLGWQFDGESGIRTRFFWFNALSTPETLVYDPDVPVVADLSLSAPPGLANLPGQQQFLDTGGSVLFAGGFTSTANFSSYVRLYAIDLEYTHERTTGRFDGIFSAGGRYLNADQSYRAYASASGLSPLTGDPTFEEQALDSTQNFSGGGPTVAWLGRMRIGESRFKAYGGVRGSLLAGTYTNRLAFTYNEFNSTSGDLLFTNGSIVNNVAFGLLPVGELETGVEYDGDFGNRRWFTRVGAVAIDYFGLGNPNGATGDLLLLGGEIAVGIRY